MANEATMTVQEASALMGKSQSFIRIGLQRNILPFGYAVKTGKDRYSYFISREKFTQATGIKSFIGTTGIKCEGVKE
jgi:hypothetical protein